MASVLPVWPIMSVEQLVLALIRLAVEIGGPVLVREVALSQTGINRTEAEVDRLEEAKFGKTTKVLPAK